MPVPYTFGTATAAIPLSNLDANFNTPVTIGNTTVGLGNTVTTLGNVTLTNVTITSGTINAAVVDSGYVANSVVYADSTGVLTAGSANLVFTGTNIGIGTSSPSTQLQMNSSAATYSDQLRVRNTNFGNADIGVGSGIMAIATDMANITFYTSSNLGTTGSSVPTNERMRIDSSGNVGIGTISPSYVLHVNKAQGSAAVQSTTTTNSTYLAFINGGGTSYVGVDNSTGGVFSSGAYGMTLFNAANSATTFFTNNTERMRINAGAPILCLAGGNTSATGTGIAFPATQSASSDANTLDDYEEGTWTPTITGGTTAGTTTYNGTQRGTYTKIGRQVTVAFYVNYTAATGTGNLQIGGLPFVISNDDPVGAVMTDSLNWSGGTYMVLRGVSGAQLIHMWGSTDDANWTRQQMVNEAADITGTLTYFV